MARTARGYFHPPGPLVVESYAVAGCRAMASPLTGRFQGSAVFVSGGAHGIGQGCAERLAAEGARVAVADVDLAAAQAVVERMGGSAVGHMAVGLDITDADSVDTAVRAAAGGLGGLDSLVLVAGGAVLHPDFEHTDDEIWLRQIDLNLLGAMRCCRAGIGFLRDSNCSPSIVFISSVNALAGLGDEPYSAAKAGLVSLTLNLAAQYGPAGIRVNCVAPGTIRTRVWDTQEGGADRLRSLYPLGRVGEPADIAAAVAFLASSDASWITGHTLPVDGGLLIGKSMP